MLNCMVCLFSRFLQPSSPCREGLYSEIHTHSISGSLVGELGICGVFDLPNKIIIFLRFENIKREVTEFTVD